MICRNCKFWKPTNDDRHEANGLCALSGGVEYWGQWCDDWVDFEKCFMVDCL